LHIITIIIIIRIRIVIIILFFKEKLTNATSDKNKE